MNIEELADVIGCELIVRRYPNQNNRWRASLDKVEIKKGSILISESGIGSTTQEAINNYVTSIRGKLLVKNAYNENRMEFNVPNNIEGIYE